MVHKNCVVCGVAFRALGRAITCSPDCSNQNARDYNARWRQARNGDNHSRKVDRELAASLRLADRLDYVEERNREYQRWYAEANRERINAKRRERRKAKRTQYRESDRAALQRWRAKNPDRVKAWRRASYAKHKDRINAARRATGKAWAGARLFG
jgi:hypothetical protein